MFSRALPGEDPQTVVEDPRFDGATFCRAVATISNICFPGVGWAGPRRPVM
jgi:hypothetical protein